MERLTIEGNWIDNGGTFNAGSGTVQFTGSSNSTIMAQPMNSIVLIDDDFNYGSWPVANWNGDVGAGQGYFVRNVSANAGGSPPEVRFRL